MLRSSRSLRVRPDCIQRVKLAFKQQRSARQREADKQQGFARQQDLADKLKMSLSTVNNYLNGRPVDHLNFVEISEILGLDWREIAVFEDSSFEENSSSIYVERPPIEANCYEAINQPGALLRIKAPQKMGKTCFLEQVLDYARKQGYQTVKLDLRLAEKTILGDYQTFLQSLCIEVADSLELEAQLNHYWRELYGLNKNCTRYWQKHLLPNFDKPLVLALDNFETLFVYPELFDNFCSLLRGWYELAKQGTQVGQMWQKLRLVVVHSTEVYPKLDTNHSPFNVGVAIDLPEFTQEQVATFAQHCLGEKELSEAGLQELMESVGGHPYLLQQAFLALSHQNQSLEQLLPLAPTEEGIFHAHLHQQLWNLQHHPLLETAYKKVVMASEPVPLETEVGFKLHSLGLVKLSGNNYYPSCNLYRQYFSTHLGSTP